MRSRFHHLLCLSLLLLPFSTLSQPHNTIILGSTLSTLDPNPYWTSPYGEFAFGFHPLQQENLFLLSVWFAKIPIKSIVWSANGDQPVRKGSTAQLTKNGALILVNSTGSEIWKAEPLDGSRAASAAMLDTGNFVLLGSDSAVKWGTFDEPTDTILPTQILNRGAKLFARLGELDYSIGRFELALQVDRDLVLYTIASRTKGIYTSYWSTNTKDAGSQLVFDQSGDLYLTLLNGTVFNFTTKKTSNEFYHRATLDFDGVFRKYTYPKSPESNGGNTWAQSWAVPGEICTLVAGHVGSGVCGFNSYCVMDEEQRPKCECPPGYDYLYPNERFRGCKAGFDLQRCEVEDVKVTGFEMRAMVNTDWPFNDYEHFECVSEEWCSEACLRDCFCAVSIFRDGDCWLKRFPLSNGRMDTSVGGKAFVKVGYSRNCSAS